MPTDSRRLPIPDSFDPTLYKLSADLAGSLIIDDNGIRIDGRSAADVRDIFLQCGVISQAKGSAYCEMKNTKVICGVYGPKDTEHREDFQMSGKVKCEFKFAPFSCHQRRGHIPDLEETEFSDIISQALSSSICLHRYPKSQIEVFITVLENDGSALAAGLMVASLAVADACIEQYDIITAASVRVQGDMEPLQDPTKDEEYQMQALSGQNELNNGMVTVALLPTLNQVCALLSTGHIECDVLTETIETGTGIAQNLYSIARACLIGSVKA